MVRGVRQIRMWRDDTTYQPCPLCLLTPLLSSLLWPLLSNPLSAWLDDSLAPAEDWGGTHSGCLTRADCHQDWLVLSVLRAHAQSQPPLWPPSTLHPATTSHYNTLQRIIQTGLDRTEQEDIQLLSLVSITVSDLIPGNQNTCIIMLYARHYWSQWCNRI